VDPYPILWSANEISASELTAAGIVQNAVFNWSPHDTKPTKAWNCTQPLPPNHTRGPCIITLWPLIAGAGATGSANVNGGVPQAANLSAHLASLARTLHLGVRDDYTGIAAIDFENWTPLWDNDGGHGAWHSAAYPRLSIALVKQKHPSLPAAAALAKAKDEFEQAATEFFVATIRLCKKIRPRARWGFYGFPNPSFYPCTGDSCGYDSRDGPTLRARNDQLKPIFEEVDVILPSIYFQDCGDLNCGGSWNATKDDKYVTLMNQRMVKGTIKESVRLQQNTSHKPPIFAFMWTYFNTGNMSRLLSAADTRASIQLPYLAGAQGLVIWGGGPPFHDPGRKARFQSYFDGVLAPEICAFKCRLPPLATADGRSCGGNMECSLNGHCTKGTCVCYPGWTGGSCGLLALLPTPPGHRGSAAYPPPAMRDTTAWGGRAVYDAASKIYHGWFSEMGHHCGMDVWQRASMCRHATSTNPAGPYTPVQAETIGVDCHNPSIIAAPNGSLLLFHIGSGKPVGSGDQWHDIRWQQSSPPPNCTNGTTPPAPPKPAHILQSAWGPPVAAFWVSDGAGKPWRPGPPAPVTQFSNGRSGNPFDNPAPYIFPNGSMMVAFVLRCSKPCNNSNGIAFTEHWASGVWRPMVGDNFATQLFPAPGMGRAEDPFVWVRACPSPRVAVRDVRAVV
jgi:hyaluronoglucosaminidase